MSNLVEIDVSTEEAVDMILVTMLQADTDPWYKERLMEIKDTRESTVMIGTQEKYLLSRFIKCHDDCDTSVLFCLTGKIKTITNRVWDNEVSHSCLSELAEAMQIYASFMKLAKDGKGNE